MKRFFTGIIAGNLIGLILISGLVYSGFLDFRLIDVYAEPEPSGVSQFFMTKETADMLNNYYNSYDNEFSVCVDVKQLNTFDRDGTMLELEYLVDGFIGEPSIQGFDYSFSDMCEYGVLHSHPRGTSFFSLADINAFKNRIKEGEIVSIVMYGEDDFAYITRNYFEEQKIIILNT